MVLGPLAFLSLLGAPFLLGLAVLRALGIVPRTDPIAYGGWAWIVGSLGTSGIVFVWAWIASDMGSAWIPAGMVFAAALVIFLAARRSCFPILEPGVQSGADARRGAGSEEWFFRVALAFVLFVTVERILAGSLFGIILTDEGQFWALRAKILFESGGFGQAFADEAQARSLDNIDYPFHSSLMHLWTFAHAGRITHVVNRLPVVMSSLALVLVLGGALRRHARPGTAALLLLLLPAMYETIRGANLAMCDVPVAAGVVVGLDAYLRRRADGYDAWLALGSLSFAFAAFNKHEGEAIVGTAFVALFVARLVRGRESVVRASAEAAPRAVAAVLALLPIAAVLVVTWRVNVYLGAMNLFVHNLSDADFGATDREGNFATLFVAQFSERIRPILDYFATRVYFDVDHSRFLIPTFFVLAILCRRRLLRGPLLVPTLAIAFASVGFVLVFIGLPKGLDYHLSTAATRVGFQTVPAIVLWMGVVSADLQSSKRTLHRILVALLAINTAFAVVGPARELAARTPRTFERAFAASEEERVTARIDRIEANSGDRGGVYADVYRAIVANVPADDLIVIGVERDRYVQLLHVLRNVTYPRRYSVQIVSEGGIASEVVERIAGTAWGLDLYGLDDVLSPHFERVTGGTDWSLWR